MAKISPQVRATGSEPQARIATGCDAPRRLADPSAAWRTADHHPSTMLRLRLRLRLRLTRQASPGENSAP
ncbi:hypothetical protein [Frankia tisae]|uniref:hypothetical protein n=1 Tax=Frankia tisae TaxID=2950104 RepID=UPI0021C0D98A|nr:hypothetical protein [Frankia tisae]